MDTTPPPRPDAWQGTDAWRLVSDQIRARARAMACDGASPRAICSYLAEAVPVDPRKRFAFIRVLRAVFGFSLHTAMHAVLWDFCGGDHDDAQMAARYREEWTAQWELLRAILRDPASAAPDPDARVHARIHPAPPERVD